MFNQAIYLGEAIQSILDQTYNNYEIIVVNDASPDHVGEVVYRFNDPRIKYIVHHENLGLPASRNTGIRASSGQIIALLDADDLFLPQKLELHKRFLEKHPEIGVSYNARFGIEDSGNTILDLWRPSLEIDLSDLVLGFPFTPSDMVIRRNWVYKVDLFDESYFHFSEDLDINCRLALAGCKFAGIDKVLNYRRYHSGRKIKYLDKRLNSALRALDSAFADTRCPIEVKNLRDVAYANNYLIWACYAMYQEETNLGQKLLRESVGLNPSLIDGKPSELIDFLVNFNFQDKNIDHERFLSKFIDQLPPEFNWISQEYDWAVSRGFLIRGTQAIMWGRNDLGQELLTHAEELGAKLDERFLRGLTAQVINYEAEFCKNGTEEIISRISQYLEILGDPYGINYFNGLYLFVRGINYYQEADYSQASSSIIRALKTYPKFISNRGIMSLLLRSLIKLKYLSFVVIK